MGLGRSERLLDPFQPVLVTLGCPKRSLAQGFSLKGPCPRGGHKLQFFGRETYIAFSKHLRPKRSLNARLGHSKAICGRLRELLGVIRIAFALLFKQPVCKSS